MSVIVSDLFLLYGVYRSTLALASLKRNLIWLLVIWSPGLLIVDHLHFQYNGFLFGWLLLSLSFLAQGRDVMGGFLFAVLLCFKHLFAVAAPVYFVYLLRHYCRGGLVRGFARLSVMGAIVVAVFAAAYGPFVYHGQIQQVIRRMFPFGRGLCHAYWAPNFWVFYIMLDKGIAFLLRKFGFNIPAPVASFTGGLVGDASPFAILPRVTPLTTFIIVLLALSPCLFRTWKDPRPRLIVRSVAYAYTCGFLFGWHVHEKASLHFSIPLAIVAVESLEDAKHYFLLSIDITTQKNFSIVKGTGQAEALEPSYCLSQGVKIVLNFSAQYSGSLRGVKKGGEKQGFEVGWVTKSYLIGVVVVEIW
ncbi:hypothetical protein Gotri_023898, partial [Gossypium trilobum]|nr:hypothetical protein [Gossypium trilobum]